MTTENPKTTPDYWNIPFFLKHRKDKDEFFNTNFDDFLKNPNGKFISNRHSALSEALKNIKNSPPNKKEKTLYDVLMIFSDDDKHNNLPLMRSNYGKHHTLENFLKSLIKDISKKKFSFEDWIEIGMPSESLTEFRYSKDIPPKNVSIKLDSHSISQVSGKEIYSINIKHTDENGKETDLSPILAGTNIDLAQLRLKKLEDAFKNAQHKMVDKDISLQNCKNVIKAWKSQEASNKYLSL